jgi:hypothetical protein
METDRSYRFKVGRSYRVLRGFRSGMDEFVLGEVLLFQSASHSRYDESSAFLFRAALGGELKTWFLYDGDPDNGAELFQELPEIDS